MMLPRLTLPPTTTLLRVIDNDNGVEVPRLFQKVVPHYYKPNKVSSFTVIEMFTTLCAIDGIYHNWGGVVT